MKIAHLTYLLGSLLLACSCSPAADGDDCEGAPFASGYTLLPGPRIHEGKYSAEECAEICGPDFPQCAPTIEQRAQPRYRCGTPPPSHCGPRHQPRVSVENADVGE